MDRGAWQATVHALINSQTQLNMQAHTYHPWNHLPLFNSEDESIIIFNLSFFFFFFRITDYLGMKVKDT